MKRMRRQTNQTITLDSDNVVDAMIFHIGNQCGNSYGLIPLVVSLRENNLDVKQTKIYRFVVAFPFRFA
jgi:hypothetical protein